MEESIVKNNYFYITYLVLKKYSSSEGKHLTSNEIGEKIHQEYGVQPNVKTILNALKELTAFGFDIAYDKSKKTLGYYLGKRALSQTELQLLIDGIESIDNIPTDDKLAVYQKLCDIVGMDSGKINNYLYDKRNEFNEILDEDEEFKHKIDVILEGIRKKRKLFFFFIPNLTILLLKYPSPKAKEYLLDVCQPHLICPHQIFRNKDNELFLLFYIKIYDEVYPGAVRINSMESVEVTEERMDKVDTSVLFNFSLSDFTDARTYACGQQILHASLVTEKGLGWFDKECLKDCTVSLKERTCNGQVRCDLAYKLCDEDQLFEYLLEFTIDLRILPGSDLFDRVVKTRDKLNGMC